MPASEAVSGRLARFVASAGGVGHVPVAPGTFGSLAALPLGAALLPCPVSLLAASAVATALGVPATQRATNGEDAGWVVIDEVAGMLLTLAGLATLPGLPAPRGRSRLAAIAGAFGLFRLLDITKPGPIGRLDRRPDAFGVMADDLAAGALGATLLLLTRLLLARRPRR